MKIRFDITYFCVFTIILAVEALIAIYISNIFIRYYLSDVLVVVLIYCFIKALIGNKIKDLWLYIFFFATLIEFGQYFNLVDLLGFGEYHLVRIILGTTFDIKDIACYAVGCVGIWLFERVTSKNAFIINLLSKNSKVINLLLLGIVIMIVIHVADAIIHSNKIEYKEVSFYSTELSVEMDGYRIAFITDTHDLPVERLREVVQRVNEFEIDLLLLGGDFPSADGEPWRSMVILSEITTVDGIYGVEGNHDNYKDLFAAMSAYGITPLSNFGVRLRDYFYIAGVEDLWNRNPNIVNATVEASQNDFVLLLTHNPDVTMKQDTHHVDLILAGHTHGGQVTFFGIWAPYFTLRNTITDYGQRFVSGWAKSRDGVPVYISNGLDNHAPRIFARPQVIILTLYHEK